MQKKYKEKQLKTQILSQEQRRTLATSMRASSFNAWSHKVVKYLPDSLELRTEESSAKFYALNETAFK